MSIDTKTLTAAEARAFQYDLGCWFCGYEERSPWLINSTFRPIAVEKWIRVEVLEDRNQHWASRNLKNGLELGSLLGSRPAKRNWDGHWRMQWRELISDEFKRRDYGLKIFIDISSMPRAIYGTLLIESCRTLLGKVSDIVLAYVPGIYRDRLSGRQQLDGLRGLAGLEGRSRYDAEPALLLGLGYDGVLADTVVDLFQIEHFSCFYSDPGVNEESAERCRTENNELLQHAELVEPASIRDITTTIRAINRLASWYVHQRDIILLPIGPKLQVAASIIAAIQEPRLGFRCLRTSVTRAIDVGVESGTIPIYAHISLAQNRN
ncbi:MAG: hypothetical protein JXA30_19045 [Deltaproteobacteria bacterium]|nr:hypothetical protein [Deltaproteobacteria bacterium]